MTARTASRPRFWSGERGQEALVGYLFVLPCIIGFALFIGGPILATILISFTDFDLLTPPQLAGLDNFVRLFSDSRLRTVYVNTFVFTIFAVMLNVGLGLLLALLLNRRLPRILKFVFRSAYFFPSLVALVFVSIIWQFLYQRDTGVINYYLSSLGMPRINWISSPQFSLASVIILDVWKNAGFAMLVFLAGLQGISAEYYEAARVDGANRWQIFRSITLPLLSPTILFVTTIYLIGALQVFDSIVVLTNGGPGDSSRSVVLYIYERAFRSFDMGYASAISLTLLAVIGLVTAVQFRLARRWVHYE